MLAGIKKAFSSLIERFRQNKPESTQIVESIPVEETVPGSREFVSIAKKILSLMTIDADTPADQLLNKIKEILSRTEDELSKADHAAIQELLQTEFKVPMISARRLPSGHAVSFTVLKNLDQEICPYTGQAFEPENVIPDDLISILSMIFFDKKEVAEMAMKDTDSILLTLRRISNNENNVFPDEVVQYVEKLQKLILNNMALGEELLSKYANIVSLSNSILHAIRTAYPLVLNPSWYLLFFYTEHYHAYKGYAKGLQDANKIETDCKLDMWDSHFYLTCGQLDKSVTSAVWGVAYDYMEGDEIEKAISYCNQTMQRSLLSLSLSTLVVNGYAAFCPTLAGKISTSKLAGPVSLLTCMTSSFMALIISEGFNFGTFQSLAYFIGFTEKYCQTNPDTTILVPEGDYEVTHYKCKEYINFSYFRSGYYEENRDSWLPVLLSTAAIVTTVPLALLCAVMGIKHRLKKQYQQLPEKLARDLLESSAKNKFETSEKTCAGVKERLFEKAKNAASFCGSLFHRNRYRKLEEASDIELGRIPSSSA